MLVGNNGVWSWSPFTICLCRLRAAMRRRILKTPIKSIKLLIVRLEVLYFSENGGKSDCRSMRMGNQG